MENKTTLHIREELWGDSLRYELQNLIIDNIANGTPIVVPHETIRPIRADIAETLIHMARIASKGNTWVWFNIESDDVGMTFTPVTVSTGEQS